MVNFPSHLKNITIYICWDFNLKCWILDLFTCFTVTFLIVLKMTICINHSLLPIRKSTFLIKIKLPNFFVVSNKEFVTVFFYLSIFLFQKTYSAGKINHHWSHNKAKLFGIYCQKHAILSYFSILVSVVFTLSVVFSAKEIMTEKEKNIIMSVFSCFGRLCCIFSTHEIIHWLWVTFPSHLKKV